MVYKKNLFFAVMPFVMFFIASCSHQLEIKNIQSYQNLQMEALRKPVSIGVIQTPEDEETKLIVKGVGSALGTYSARVVLPYAPSVEKKADYVVNIAINPEYNGSGWNFLINWPGFLIWTPVWNGYAYEVKYNVSLAVTRVIDGKNIDSWTMPIILDIRHASFDRTWTEISWLEVSAIAFIGGFYVTKYDTDITPLVVEKVERPIGDYIAKEIVQRINSFTDTPITTKGGDISAN